MPGQSIILKHDFRILHSGGWCLSKKCSPGHLSATGALLILPHFLRPSIKILIVLLQVLHSSDLLQESHCYQANRGVLDEILDIIIFLTIFPPQVPVSKCLGGYKEEEKPNESVEYRSELNI